jgi:acyl-coenzyme A thioesterase PaaI-like protein
VPAPQQLNSDGSLFGAYIMAGLADQARAFAAMTMVPPNAAVRTINLQAHFMMGGRAHPLRIEARVAAMQMADMKVWAHRS